jgi:alpha-glucosidase
VQAWVAEGDVLVMRRQYAGPSGLDALLLAFNLGSTAAAVSVPTPAAGVPQGPPLFTHGGAALDGARLTLPAGAVLFAQWL